MQSVTINVMIPNVVGGVHRGVTINVSVTVNTVTSPVNVMERFVIARIVEKVKPSSVITRLAIQTTDMKYV